MPGRADHLDVVQDFPESTELREINAMWKKRIRIVVEKRRRQVEGGQRFDGPCSVCGCEVQTLTRREAAAFLQIALAEVDALAASGRIHAVHTAAGDFRVCQQSLWRNPQ